MDIDKDKVTPYGIIEKEKYLFIHKSMALACVDSLEARL